MTTAQPPKPSPAATPPEPTDEPRPEPVEEKAAAPVEDKSAAPVGEEAAEPAPAVTTDAATAAPTAAPTAETLPEPGAGPGAETQAEAEPGNAALGTGVPKDRRVLRAMLRWTAVVTVFAALGAGTAYGITSMERTDVPGLATESDGRWAYPELTMPPVPSGSPRPFDTKNWGQSHYADLRALLLPAPEGATDDKALRGADGWLPTKDFLTVFESKEDQEAVGRLLTDHGLRHIAARGWTTPDGTGTRVYLLQFDTGTVADNLYGELTTYGAPRYAARGATTAEFDDKYPTAADFDTMSVMRYSYDEVKPYGAEHLRQSYLRAGDVIALVLQSRKGTAAAVPFQQTVTLQSQLLG
ncbi:hypothetical protein J2X68_001247 [Streptomyces sp. 3330]|uniref:hypothetical protein n=1 Tax=Streptomyces sp. 3330 TaxID=2817755 RepID=UPI00285E7C9C|nr:hypothetical protein [Streptomyces sp. 3330]MDR6974569.1 hypothetical protein [Streptomyces sp. 3330]